MARKYLTAGLLLVLTLSLTACGTSDKAGTSAHRWDGGTTAASQDWAIQRQADRGTTLLKSVGAAPTAAITPTARAGSTATTPAPTTANAVRRNPIGTRPVTT